MARIAGTVVEVRDGRAWIQCRAPGTSCGACASGRGCNWRTLEGSRRLEVPAVLDGRSLEAGEAVDIVADEAALFTAALQLYLPPLAGLIAGPALARWLGWDAAALFAAGVGWLLGSLAARAWTRTVPTLALHRP